MNLLERALQIAVKAHAGQYDRAGEAYIFHPIRVMGRCTSPEAKIVALLHDTVEDTDISFDDLRAEGFPESILDHLRLVTHDPELSYDEYIDAMLHDPIAIEVKLADLDDNLDLRRLGEITEKDIERVKKYLRVHRRLKTQLKQISREKSS